ncbi:MAG: helix-turn-helix transcriptional regulator [Coriobacteriales bacterium]|jgi:DNA-binding Xre family transcriptional regulator|nr:helix-turn-helix transcriptional regulator [Coriobacteriales bacterium]
MYNYNLLWKILIDRGINRSDLIEIAGLSPTTIAAMGKGAGISPKVLERLCQALDVQPGDIMEYVKS